MSIIFILLALLEVEAKSCLRPSIITMISFQGKGHWARDKGSDFSRESANSNQRSQYGYYLLGFNYLPG